MLNAYAVLGGEVNSVLCWSCCL